MLGVVAEVCGFVTRELNRYFLFTLNMKGNVVLKNSLKPAPYLNQGSTLKSVIITGITGQDVAYLAELLLNKGYIFHGTFRHTSSAHVWRIKGLSIRKHPNLHLVEYDLTDLGASVQLLQSTGATEVYNLAAQSFVCVSFAQPITAAEITGVGAVNLLEAIRIVNPAIRFCQASTSAMFGKVQVVPQSEGTPFCPRSPYGLSKAIRALNNSFNDRESYSAPCRRLRPPYSFNNWNEC
jgi:GDPmannose 4,6-dehydratase